MAGVALRNAVQSLQPGSILPATQMTGDATQTVLGAVDPMGGVKRDARLAVRIRFVQTPFSQTHPSHYQRSVAGRKAHPFKLRRWKSCCSRSKQNRPVTVNYGRQNAARRSRSAGSVNWKTAPRGVPELAHSLPPWASTIERQIDSPIPNPLVLVV